VIELGLRITFSLLVVLVMMWGVARAVRRPLAGRAGGLVAVLGRQQLTRNSAVTVVRVADRAFVLGVTDNQVTLLAETALDAVESPQPVAAPERRSPVPLGDDGAAPAPRPVAVKPLAPAAGGLGGSILSPATWTQTMEFLRERTARR